MSTCTPMGFFSSVDDREKGFMRKSIYTALAGMLVALGIVLPAQGASAEEGCPTTQEVKVFYVLKGWDKAEPPDLNSSGWDKANPGEHNGHEDPGPNVPYPTGNNDPDNPKARNWFYYTIESIQPEGESCTESSGCEIDFNGDAEGCGDPSTKEPTCETDATLCPPENSTEPDDSATPVTSTEPEGPGTPTKHIPVTPGVDKVPTQPQPPDTDCTDYLTQADAQGAYEAGQTSLDRDGDGVACESTPQAGPVTPVSVLPNTGAPNTLLALMGLGLISLGLLLVRSQRQRA